MTVRRVTSESAVTASRFPQGRVGPYLPVSDDDIDAFNDALSDEIDSSFTTSICCCDFCYDDFKELWPDVAFRELEFQSQSMDVRWLVEYSRLPGTYSQAEISTLQHFVRCERCARYDPCNVWLYEHRFSGAKEIEASIEELLKLGCATPFLLLEHPFAQRVLLELRTKPKTAFLPIGTSLYRARTKVDVDSCGQSNKQLTTYGAPPADVVGEGRFNHAGAPMLYLASSPAVAAVEIDKPDEICSVGQLRLTTSLQVLDLVEIDEDDESYELLSALACSALLAAPRTGTGWLKRQYVFSRFVADCARSAGYDAIRYGSTKHTDGCNYVLLNPPKDIASIATLIDSEEHIGSVSAKS